MAERLEQKPDDDYLVWYDVPIGPKQAHPDLVVLPHQMRKGSGSFDPRQDTIKILTMHVSKGLEFPVVALPGVGQMPEDGESEADEARLFYVAATRATQSLFITVSGTGAFGARLTA